MYKNLLFGLLLFYGCKTSKQDFQHKNRLPAREDGFYYTKDDKYTTEEYLLLKFYNDGRISELAISGGVNEINTTPQFLACVLDNNLSKLQKISYILKGDSIFFKKKAWDSHEFSTLFIACKAYGDSIVARVTPFDYFDTLEIKLNRPSKSFITTYKFKQGFCDTVFLGTLPKD